MEYNFLFQAKIIVFISGKKTKEDPSAYKQQSVYFSCFRWKRRNSKINEAVSTEGVHHMQENRLIIEYFF